MRTRSGYRRVVPGFCVFACLVLLLLAGCSTEEASRKGLYPHQVEIVTRPRGAKLMVWSVKESERKQLVVVGLTPQKLSIDGPTTVLLHEGGFRAVAVRPGWEDSVEIDLEPAEEDGFYDEIWSRWTFQGYDVVFADDEVRRRSYVVDSPDLPPEVRRAVLAGELIHGMTPEQVGAVLGKPKAVVTREWDGAAQHKWIYDGMELFFERGVLLTWRE